MNYLQIIIGIIAVLGFTFIIYCYETAQLVNESFQPLEPQKHLKDTETTKLILYLIIFFSLVFIVSYLFYPICTLF
jgi:hypothetical protein